MITYFKKHNNHSTAAVREMNEKNMEKIAVWTSMSAVKEEEEVLQMLEQMLLQVLQENIVEEVVPLAPHGRPQLKRYPRAAHRRSHKEQLGMCFEESCRQ